MTQLFNVLDSIISAHEFGHADTITTLSNTDDIIGYAEAAGVSISDGQAERISKVGLEWINSVENGSGEWSQYRDDAKDKMD